MERIHAFARGQSWSEGAEAATEIASEEDGCPDRDSDSDFDEEMGRTRALGRNRKRGRAAGAEPAEDDESCNKNEKVPNKRRRAKVQHVEPPAFAVQRLPLGAVRQIGIALDYDTKLALSSTCHLAREALFNNRMMDEHWIRAYARKRQGERTIQSCGSKAFALQTHVMQSSCEFEARYVRSGRYKYLFRLPDLFECAFETHGGWKGFIAALEQRKRRSDAQYRALELRPIRRAIDGLVYQLLYLPAELQTACAAVRHELNAMLRAIRTRQAGNAHDVQKGMRQCRDAVARLKIAARLLKLHEIQQALMRYPAGFGVSEHKRDSLLEELGQLQQQCESASTIEALPPTADMERVTNEVIRMQRTVAQASVVVESIERKALLLRNRLSAVPDKLQAGSTIVLQDVNSLQGAISTCTPEDVPHLQQAADECGVKVDRLEAAARLLSPRGIQSELLRCPGASATDKGEYDSTVERFDRLRKQCESATTVEELPTAADIARLEAEVREMVVKASERAGREVKEFLAERQRIESQWTTSERADFIRRELARLLGVRAPPGPLVELYTMQSDPSLTSETVIGILGATDDTRQRGGLHFMPQDLRGQIHRRMAQKLTSRGEPWKPSRDEFIQQFIQEGLRLRAQCSVRKSFAGKVVMNTSEVHLLRGVGESKHIRLRHAGITTIGELAALTDDMIPTLTGVVDDILDLRARARFVLEQLGPEGTQHVAPSAGVA